MIYGRSDYDAAQDIRSLIPRHEPVFLLRGQDQVGWEAVEFWAKVNAWAKGDPRASDLAMVHARRMREWPNKKPCDL